jgi:hypothetical protein
MALHIFLRLIAFLGLTSLSAVVLALPYAF